MRGAVGMRNHPTYWAFVLHRVSGLALAIFVPAHLYTLALAVNEAARFDSFIAWTDMPVVKIGESVLVLLLAGHLVGGLRLLALEFLPWRDWQKGIVAITIGVAVAAALLFLMNAY
jgi:fumarate reductase subunit D